MTRQYYLDSPSGINLNPAHRGKFTEWARRHGFKSVQAAARHVLANRDHYPAEIVKMANFAHNATKFHHGDTESRSENRWETPTTEREEGDY